MKKLWLFCFWSCIAFSTGQPVERQIPVNATKVCLHHNDSHLWIDGKPVAPVIKSQLGWLSNQISDARRSGVVLLLPRALFINPLPKGEFNALDHVKLGPLDGSFSRQSFSKKSFKKKENRICGCSKTVYRLNGVKIPFKKFPDTWKTYFLELLNHPQVQAIIITEIPFWNPEYYADMNAGAVFKGLGRKTNN
jgi:hypothetical protein